jgi:hypothetical protein
MGAVAKSYMRKFFLIYEEMRNYLVICEEAISHIWLCICSLLFLFSFYQCIFQKILISQHYPFNSPHTVLRLSSASTTSPWVGGACLPPAAVGWRSWSGSGMENLNKFFMYWSVPFSPYSFLLISDMIWMGGRVVGSSAVMLPYRTAIMIMIIFKDYVIAYTMFSATSSPRFKKIILRNLCLGAINKYKVER